MRWHDVSSVVLEEGLTRVGDNAFGDCDGLEDVTLPKSLKVIGKKSFSHAGGHWDPAKINLPDGLDSIGESAFEQACISFTTLLPDGLKYIGKAAFYRSNISSINLPKSLNYIGDEAFQQTNISSVSFPRRGCGI